MDWRTSVSTIKTGNAGNRQTLGAMSRLAMEGALDPVVIHAAQQAVRGTRERNPDGDFDAILADVRRRMRYTHDPLGAEVVKAPRFVIDSTTGRGATPEPMDCDDASTLTSAMLGAIGYRTKFVTVAVDRKRPSEWSHVYVAADPGDGSWVALDPIVPDFGVGDEVPAGQLTAPRAYHEGVDPMIGRMGCNAAGGDYRMAGLGRMGRFGAATYAQSVAAERANGNDYANDPSTWDVGRQANTSGVPGGASSANDPAWYEKLFNSGVSVFESVQKTNQANAAAQIAAANARAARNRGLPAPGAGGGFFKNADGSTNMVNVALVGGAALFVGFAVMKAMRR